MPSTILLIKNMVCTRCIMAVEYILTKELIPFQKVIISQATLCNELSEDQKDRLIKSFKSIGFELIDNRNSALIENIKQLVMKKARNEMNENENKLKLSHYISGQVNHEYTYLSSLFS
ncbi:MAG: AraC family transcriptional regulator, partial [Xanthomarina sp.]